VNNLLNYSTTLEEDYMLLNEKGSELNNNIKNAILMRIGEKEVKHSFL